MHIVSFQEADVPAELRVQVLALQHEAWPGDTEPAEHVPTHDPSLRPLSMLLVDGDRVLSALDILSKEIEHRGVQYDVSGLSTVVTDPALRRRGYGVRLVEAAREHIEASGADLGIFTCDLPLRAFYERAGWQVLVGTVLVGGTPEVPYPSDQFEKVTMGLFCSEKGRRAATAFTGARIELYPGEIDRLW